MSRTWAEKRLKSTEERLDAAEAEIGRLEAQVESLQQKVHLCAGYDKQAAEIARLRAVLENIRDHAISNGEDCAYLDARASLKETE